jgi:hypothetical protein
VAVVAAAMIIVVLDKVAAALEVCKLSLVKLLIQTQHM